MVFLLYLLKKKSASTNCVKICHEFGEDKKPLKLLRVLDLGVVFFDWNTV